MILLVDAHDPLKAFLALADLLVELGEISPEVGLLAVLEAPPPIELIPLLLDHVIEAVWGLLANKIIETPLLHFVDDDLLVVGALSDVSRRLSLVSGSSISLLRHSAGAPDPRTAPIALVHFVPCGVVHPGRSEGRFAAAFGLLVSILNRLIRVVALSLVPQVAVETTGLGNMRLLLLHLPVLSLLQAFDCLGAERRQCAPLSGVETGVIRRGECGRRFLRRFPRADPGAKERARH